MIFDVLVGETITDISKLQVIEKSGFFDFLDTCVIKLANNRMLQLSIDTGHKQMTFINDAEPIMIWGEFTPVQIKLLPFINVCLTLPIFIEEVITYTATHPLITGTWEDAESEKGSSYILGAVLKNSSQEFFIRTAGEDLEIQSVEDAESFFRLCDLKFKKWHNK